MRIGLVASLLLLTATVPAAAQVSLSINIGSYPNFTAVPGYPVYYAPDVGANYFFYNGLYWVYQDDNWYSSSWYNGPWDSVGPMYVPTYMLQVPVRYYRRPPQYFRGWQPDQSPRWNDHWGHDWTQHRPNWDQPRHEVNATPAPLPDYQRRYSGNNYPRADQQQVIRQQNYHYQPPKTRADRDPGKQPAERRPAPAQTSANVQPTRAPVAAQPHDSGKAQRSQPQPAPQQDQEKQQVRRAPQQDQHPPVTPKPEQTYTHAERQHGNPGAATAARKSPEQAHESGQMPRNDHAAQNEHKEDKDHNRD